MMQIYTKLIIAKTNSNCLDNYKCKFNSIGEEVNRLQKPKRTNSKKYKWKEKNY